jgi:hypothetical protein
MTKLLGILVIALVIWGGYEMFEVWDHYDTDKDLKQKEEEAAKYFTPESLPGSTYDLEKTYKIAQQNGATGIGNWLKAYGAQIQDPRKAWIELDYVVAIAGKDPVEAKKVYADVKARVPESSPVFKRVKELQSTYE